MYCGGWSYAGGNGLRLCVDIAQDPVDHYTGIFHAQIWVYVQNQYSYGGDVQALNYSGWIGGSDAITNSGGAGSTTLKVVKDLYYNYGIWGASPGNLVVDISLSGAYNGSTPGIHVDIPIPARPYGVPLDPTNANAWRDNDTQASVTWTNNGSAPYGDRPWTGVIVSRHDFGPAGWGPWNIVAYLPGDANFFVQQGLVADRIFAFAIQASNPAGVSNWVNTPWVYMTPAASSNVHSALGGSGTTIETTWTNNAYPAAHTFTIERSVGGGAWAEVVSGLAWPATSWIDPAPGAGVNQYRVKVVQGGLSSAWATGNSVSTVVPPLAPTLLAPDGLAVDLQFVGAFLTWQHNHGGDFAAQSHLTIESSIDAGGSWQARATNVASAVSSWTLPAGVLNNNQAVLWRVKTQGGTTAGFGPFSNAATITARTTPTVTLNPTLPTDPLLSLPLIVAWTYSQAQASPQTGWEADLYAADGVTLLERQYGDDAAVTAAFVYPVQDGSTCVVKVRARSGDGMWSLWASKTTTVDLPPPAPAHVAPVYQPCTGTMVLSLWADTPGVGEVVVDSIVVERRVAGGDWVVLARDITVPTTMLDLIPLTNGNNEYRVTSISTTPSTLVNPIVTVPGTDGQNLGPGRDGLWVFLSYGSGFSTVLRAHSDLDIADSSGRAQKVQGFLGRRKLSGLYGVGVSREVSVGAALRYVDPCPNPDTCRYDSPPVDWIAAGQDAEIVCYRDFTGRRIFAALDGLHVSDGYWPGNASIGFKVTEVDYTEVTGVIDPNHYQSRVENAGSTDSFVMKMNNAKLIPVNSAGSTDAVVYTHGVGAGSGVGKRLYVNSAGSTDSATVVKTP